MDQVLQNCSPEERAERDAHAKRFAPVLEELYRETVGIRDTIIEHDSEGGICQRKRTWESHGFCYRELVPADTEVNLFTYSYGNTSLREVNTSRGEVNKPWTCKQDEIDDTVIDGTRRRLARTIGIEIARKLIMHQLDESHLLTVRHRGFRPIIRVFHKETPYKVRMELREYHKDQAIDVMAVEIQRLREKITDLKYRPGGPGFENAREHFENAL